jgi:hypothetical protein
MFSSEPRHSWTRWLAVAVAIGTTATLAGTASAAKTPPPKTAADRALFQYAACMRKKGVNIPDPVRGKDGKYAFPKIPAKVLNAPGVKKKAQACAAQLPRVTRAAGPQSAAQRAQFKKFSDCMARNGVKVKQPTRRTGPPPAGQSGPAPGGPVGFFNSKDPKVKKALAKCRALLPKAGAVRG